MKVVSWNGNGALRKKLSPIANLNADLYIIQECEDPNQTDDLYYANWANNSFWIGDYKFLVAPTDFTNFLPSLSMDIYMVRYWTNESVAKK